MKKKHKVKMSTKIVRNQPHIPQIKTFLAEWLQDTLGQPSSLWSGAWDSWGSCG